ncbi:MAG: hypothetical protein R2712_26985 [Vicinamibacterales bacterium]
MRGLIGLLCFACAATLAAQTPQPFPTPRGSTPPPPQTPAPRQPAGQPAPQPASTAVQTPPAAPAAAPARAPGEPDLGEVPMYPSAVYLTSFDAGRGQRFYLYGVPLPYSDAVAYYRAALKQRGDELYEQPPTHQFDLARFRDNEMAFPPSVTVKDYTWGGGTGFINPVPGATPDRFPTIVQVVLPPGVQ